MIGVFLLRADYTEFKPMQIYHLESNPIKMQLKFSANTIDFVNQEYLHGTWIILELIGSEFGLGLIHSDCNFLPTQYETRYNRIRMQLPIPDYAKINMTEVFFLRAHYAEFKPMQIHHIESNPIKMQLKFSDNTIYFVNQEYLHGKWIILELIGSGFELGLIHSD